MPIYMLFGSTIKGSVTAADHKEWIQLDSFQFGAGRAIQQATGKGQNRETGRPSISEITVTKTADASSPKLAQELLKASNAAEVKIDFVRTGNNDTPDTWLKFTLTDTLISGYSLSSGGDGAQESLSLSFAKFEYAYTGMKVDGKPDTPFNFTYDIGQAKTV
jgi:type VI secretion system secreted protein Hcp